MRILYIDIDALRPDRLGCYGYHRNTSPHIDRIASDGVRFEQCYASDAPCLPSRTALYSGRFGIQTGVVGHGGTAASPKNEGPRRRFCDSFATESLARQLHEAGFHTAMISPFARRHAAWHFLAGFDEVHDTGQRGLESAEDIDPLLFRWLDQHQREDRWFLHVNFWDAHTPYRVPLDYGDPFAKEPLPAHLDDPELIRAHNQLVGPHGSLEINMYDDREFSEYPRQPGKITDLASMRRMVDGYDTAIRYVDDRIGRIVKALKAAGVYDDTAIIISADHGENFGELGIYGEHATADKATCRIPMIIKWPGIEGGTVNRGLQYHLDLAPTLMALLNRPASPIWSGRSFLPALEGDEAFGREEVILSQCAHVCQRSVRWDRWLYMRTYHDGFHLFPDEMLFDIAHDPYERTNLTSDHPECVREGAWRLARWHEAQMRGMSGDQQDPLRTVLSEGGPYHANALQEPQRIARYLNFLAQTGRADGAAALRKKHRLTR